MTKPLSEKAYCNGCDHFIQDPLKETAKACCPDSDYKNFKRNDIKATLKAFKEEFIETFGYFPNDILKKHFGSLAE